MFKKSFVDFGKTAHDYASHREGFPDSFFRTLFALGVLPDAGAVLDIGTGTGSVARGFARQGYEVTGLDPSENLMNEARVLDQKANVHVHYVTGKAEATGLPDHSFDIVTAGQCFHWFDKEAAVREISRVLKPGGWFIIAYFDWISRPGNPVDAMYALQTKYNPDWKINYWPGGFYPMKPGELLFESFASKANFLYEENIPYTHIGWRGRMRAYAGIGGSLPKPVVEKFDAEFSEVLKEKFKEEPMLIPHKIWAELWQVQS